jgi:cyclase
MLKKRLIGMVTVKNGWAVQSFAYRRYLPLGKPECLVENLDRWGADEILVQVIDRSLSDCGPDYELLEKIARLGLGTPLIYGGGIRTVEEGVRVIQSGADRLLIDALLHDDISVVFGLGNRLGAQAIIASMPMATGVEGPEWLNYRYRSKATAPMKEALAKTIEQGVVSEVLLTDWRHEGTPHGFDDAMIDLFPYKKLSLIAFGGISSAGQMQALLSRPNVAAVAVGNFLNYREHAIQQLKMSIASATLRPPTYATEYSLQANI